MRLRSVVFLGACLGLSCWVAFSQDSTGNVITGGAKATVLRQYNGPVLPNPQTVVVQNFILQGELVPDESMAERLHQHGIFRSGADSDSDPQAMMKSLEASFAKAFIASLKKQGIEAAQSVSQADSTVAATLVVKGEFLGINEGDRTKRIMVGFGRGGSDIKAHVVVSLIVPGAPDTVVLECNIDAKSGKQPGAVATMGVSSLAVGAATHSVGDGSSTVQKDAASMGKLVAKEVEQAMAAQKWITLSSK